MDEDAQLDAIVDKLVGVPPETLPPLSAFNEPWRTIYRRVTRAAEYADACYLIYRASEHLEDRSNVTRDLYDRLPGDDVFAAYPSLLEMAGRFPTVDWLWPSWIPRGSLTLLGAAPGAGKRHPHAPGGATLHSAPSFPSSRSTLPSGRYSTHGDSEIAR